MTTSGKRPGARAPTARQWQTFLRWLRRCRGEALLLGLVLLYAGVMWVWGVGRLDVAHSMEAARAVGARTMLRTGDYLIPRIGARYNLAKPPLFYWAVAAVSGLAGGVSAATVRLPSAAAAMTVLLILYLAVRPVFGRATACVSCVVAATLPMVFAAATVGEVNMMLALAVTGSLLSAFYMLDSTRWWPYAVLSGSCLAMGVMTKGPIILMFFVPTVLLYVGYRRGGRLADDWRWSLAYMAAIALLVRLALALSTGAGPAGGLLYVVPAAMLLYFGLRGAGGTRQGACWAIVLAAALLLTAPWPILAAERLGFARLQAALVREAWQLRSSHVGASNRDPIWYYLQALPAAGLPYSLLVPLAFVPGYGSCSSARQRRMLLLARCWLAGSIVLFTVASPARKVRYLLPVFPAMSLLAADVLVRGTSGTLRGWMNRYVRSGRAFCVYALCLAPFVLTALWFAAGLRLSGWAVGMTLAASVGAALGLYLHRCRQYRWAALVALPLVLVGAKILIHFGLSEVANKRDSPRVACRRIRERVPEGETLYLSGRARPPVMFYLAAESSGLAEALRTRGQAFVCLGLGKDGSRDVPANWRCTELERATYRRGSLVLLRVEIEPSEDAPPLPP